MKFKSVDENYLNQRKEFSEQMGKQELWSVIDHWPLYVGVANLGRYMAISDLLRSTLNVPGHLVEFGSWKGSNLMFITKLLHLFDPHSCKEVHCFESFDGLETFTPSDGKASKTEVGSYRGDYEHFKALVDLYGFNDDIVVFTFD